MNKPPFIAGLIFVLFAVLSGAYLLSTNGWDGPDGDDDDDDDDEIPSRVENYQGQQALRIPVALQVQSGIEIITPESVEWRAEFSAYGQVVDITPLLQLRANYQKLIAERDLINVSLVHTNNSLKRLKALHGEGANISTRQLQDAQAKLSTDQARLKAIEFELTNTRDEGMQSWGDVLTQWALSDAEGPLEPLRLRQESLLLIGLDNTQTLPAGTNTIYINRQSDRSGARPASLISAASHTVANLQGETYYFSTDAVGLRTGMHIHAWIANSSEPLSGVMLPVESIIWYAGRPWVYIKQSKDLFIRVAISEYQELDQRWFVQGDRFANKNIVKRGAPMLLSEEFRWQIPDEDDDP